MNKKDNAYWRNKLSTDAYQVCREQATEAPFSGTLLHNRDTGTYSCTCCEQPLFNSSNKYDSGCGWPSFNASITKECIRYLNDDSHGMVRTEIRCSQCDSHLGHIFPDGPSTTGERFCVNSISLLFSSDDLPVNNHD